MSPLKNTLFSPEEAASLDGEEFPPLYGSTSSFVHPSLEINALDVLESLSNQPAYQSVLTFTPEPFAAQVAAAATQAIQAPAAQAAAAATQAIQAPAAQAAAAATQTIQAPAAQAAQSVAQSHKRNSKNAVPCPKCGTNDEVKIKGGVNKMHYISRCNRCKWEWTHPRADMECVPESVRQNIQAHYKNQRPYDPAQNKRARTSKEYRCAKCNQPKKNHICPFAKPKYDTATMGMILTYIVQSFNEINQPLLIPDFLQSFASKVDLSTEDIGKLLSYAKTHENTNASPTAFANAMDGIALISRSIPEMNKEEQEKTQATMNDLSSRITTLFPLSGLPASLRIRYRPPRLPPRPAPSATHSTATNSLSTRSYAPGRDAIVSIRPNALRSKTVRS